MSDAHLLIIDDDVLLGEQLRSLLASLGHPAIYCGDPTKALQLIEDSTFDAVFLDYWMPSSAGGQDFFHKLVERRPELGPRVVFLTGGVLGDDTQFFIRSTGNLQLLKPFKLPAVRQVLASLMQAIAATPTAA